MRFLSLFSGIGGFDLGLEQSGHECVGQVEIDGFCQRVLTGRWPGVGRTGDVSTCLAPSVSRVAGNDGWSGIDLLVGGFPCQDLSVAGKRVGLIGERSGLFWEIVRIAKALKPTWGLFENVPGLLSSHGGRDMASVMEGLRQCWPVVGYRVLDSQHFGVPQRRRRVFFVCGPTEAGVASVFLEPEGGAGHFAASRETGAGLARCVATGTNGARYDGESETFVVTVALGGGNHGTGWRTQDDPNLVVGQCHGSNVGPMGALRSGNGDVTGGVPFIAATLKQRGRGATDEVMDNLVATLNSGGNDGGFRTEPGEHLVVSVAENQRGELRTSETAMQLRAGGGKPGEGYPAVMIAQSAVRRLTPLECERLQAFPDGWTCLCQPLTAYAVDPDGAALRCKCPDSPRYRALGNAVTVEVIAWLGRRLKDAEA